MENNIPRGICEYFQIHSLMPSFPWIVKAPQVIIASFSQISRSSNSQHCLCHNKFSCSDLETFASLCCIPLTCILHSGNILSACYLQGYLNVNTEPTAPFHSILYLSSSNSYHAMSEQLCYLPTGLSSSLASLYTAAIINFPIHHFDYGIPAYLIASNTWIFFIVQ